MRLGKLTVLTGVIIISILVILGCSDDKKTVTPTVTYGSLDDPEFVPVKVQIDDAITTVVNDILAGFDNLYVSPGDTSTVQNQLTPPAFQPDPDSDPDVLIAIYENGWHYVYATFTGDVYFAETKDSVRFQVDGVPVQFPGASVDYIHFIDNWNFTALDQEVSHTDYTGRSDFELANLNQNVAVANGTTTNSVETNYFAQDTTLANLFTFNVTLSDVNVAKVNSQWLSGCPASGVLTMTLNDSYEWSNGLTGGSGDVNWEIGVTFNAGTATVTATNGSDTWRYECEVCTILSK